MAYENTAYRRAVLSVLQKTGRHLTADEVYEELRKSAPRISKGTVYRNLRILRERGEIAALEVGGALTRFEGRQEPHYHFVCESCGSVFDLNEPVDHEMNTRIEKKTGFRVFYHHLEFRGRCSGCERTQTTK
jgi:Fur family transcriptional regulator, peroxide stress response regulator